VRSGENNPRAKNTREIIEFWREEYRRRKQPRPNQIRNSKEPTGYLSSYMVADFLGVSQSTAWAMLTEKSWRKDDEPKRCQK